MRTIGTLHPTEGTPLPPDTVVTLALTANTAAAADWPANTQIVRLTGQTTANATLQFSANLFSTGVASPAAGTSANSSAGVSHPVNQPTSFQIAGGSTGFSAISATSGFVFAECWRK